MSDANFAAISVRKASVDPEPPAPKPEPALPEADPTVTVAMRDANGRVVRIVTTSASQVACNTLDGHTAEPFDGHELDHEAPDLSALARGQRDRLLAACDWTQIPDSPLAASARQAWAGYRAALRNVPEQAAFPSAIDWPLPPT